MATETEEPTLTVDELAARAGVTVRTVRFYSTRGLLPPPAIGPRRVGHYGPAICPGWPSSRSFSTRA